MSQTKSLTKQQPGEMPSRPQWLAHWRAMETLDVSRSVVESHLVKLQACLTPIDPIAMGRKLDAILSLFKLPESFTEQSDLYMRLLEDIPEDLFDVACLHVGKTCTFFPKPAEFRKPIEDELRERNAQCNRVELVLRIGRFKPANKPNYVPKDQVTAAINANTYGTETRKEQNNAEV